MINTTQPDKKIPFEPLTINELEKSTAERIMRIDDEFKRGFAFIKNMPKTVTIFGSTRLPENNIHYKNARDRILGLVEREVSTA